MKRQPAELYSGPVTIGIDVSKWQGEIDWSRMVASPARFDGADIGPVRFAVVRTGDGKDVDTRAVRNLEGAHAAGLPCAVYHYIRAKHGAGINLDVIREVISMARVPIGFVAIDVEGGPPDDGAWLGGVSTADVLDVVREMGEALEAEGHQIVIYSGQSWHWHMSQKGIGQFAERWASWIPYYTRGSVPKLAVYPDGAPVWEWGIWQFAGSESVPGEVAGVDGRVDLNRYRGDEAALRAWMDPAERPTLPDDFDRGEIEALAARAKEAGDDEAAAELMGASIALEKCRH